MKKVFVFSVGGTGLRVMKAVTMLMAAGMNTNGYTVIPIILDPHMDLGEKKNLNVLIDDYIKIYNNTISDGAQSLNPLKGFFNSGMIKLKDLSNQQNDTDETVAQERSFGEYIKSSNVPDEDVNKYMLQSLFSQKNLDSKLSVGFKGNPNVGTVVLGDMIEGENWFKGFKNQCQDGDRIFIISSIFGGTGASGYPLIEKKIRDSKDLPAVSKATMGAVTVLPYFQLDDPGITNSDIDSANFLTKTKSALAYYEDTVESNYLYYVGEQTSMWSSYENNEKEQKDKAHFIELVAASALFDFLGREKQDTQQFMSRAIKKDVLSLDRTSLGDAYNGIIKHVADFMLLRLLMNTLPKEKYFPLKKTRKMDEEFYKSESFVALADFVERFKGWYDELATNKRAFAPLNHDNEVDLSCWVKGMTLASKDDSDFLLAMIEASRTEEQEKNNNKLRHMLRYAYDAINQFTKTI